MGKRMHVGFGVERSTVGSGWEAGQGEGFTERARAVLLSGE